MPLFRVTLRGFSAFSFHSSRPSLDVSKMAVTTGTGSRSCVRTNERARAKLVDWCPSHGGHSDGTSSGCSVGGHLLPPLKGSLTQPSALGRQAKGQWPTCDFLPLQLVALRHFFLTPFYLTQACLGGNANLQRLCAPPKAPGRAMLAPSF